MPPECERMICDVINECQLINVIVRPPEPRAQSRAVLARSRDGRRLQEASRKSHGQRRSCAAGDTVARRGCRTRARRHPHEVVSPPLQCRPAQQKVCALKASARTCAASTAEHCGGNTYSIGHDFATGGEHARRVSPFDCGGHCTVEQRQPTCIVHRTLCLVRDASATRRQGSI